MNRCAACTGRVRWVDTLRHNTYAHLVFKALSWGVVSHKLASGLEFVQLRGKPLQARSSTALLAGVVQGTSHQQQARTKPCRSATCAIGA